MDVNPFRVWPGAMHDHATWMRSPTPATRTSGKHAPGALALIAAGALLGACVAGPASEATRAATAFNSMEPIGAEAPRRVEILTVDVTNAGILGAGDQHWEYPAGVGDVLQLHVDDEPELTRPEGYRVDTDGHITLPYLGRLDVEGRTEAEIRGMVTRLLRPFRNDPRVDVRITGFHARHAAVVGAVRQPSQQSLSTTPLSVIDAINAAGGFDETADRRHATLTRGGVARPVDLGSFLTDGQALPVLRDGDVLHVARRGLRGQRIPGEIRLLDGSQPARSLRLDRAMTLADALRHARSGTAGPTYVLRAQADRIRAYAFDSRTAHHPAIGGRFTLVPGDRVLMTGAADAPPAGSGTALHLAPALSDLARG